MIAKSFNDLAPAEWDNYCALSGKASLNHLSYFLTYFALGGKDSENLSTVLLDSHDESLVAVVPLFFHKPTNSLSFGGGPLPLPALSHSERPGQERKKWGKVIDFIEEVALSKKADYLSFLAGPCLLGQQNSQVDFSLLNFGYHPGPAQNWVIDYSLNSEQRHLHMSQSHRRKISKSKREGQNVVVISSDSTPELIQEKGKAYQELHTLVAGRLTRDIKSFEYMTQLISEGIGYLFCNQFEGKDISYLYCDYQQGVARGWSQVNHPDYERSHSPRHLLEAEAIEYFASKEALVYEVGRHYTNGNFLGWNNQKLLSISDYKERLGGEPRTECTFLKFLNRAKAEKFINEQSSAFLENYFV